MPMHQEQAQQDKQLIGGPSKMYHHARHVQVQKQITERI